MQTESETQNMISREMKPDTQCAIILKRPTYCHHCGERIVYNETYPDRKNSHWAHAILVWGGKAHTVENALMEQRCKDGRHWATPARTDTLATARQSGQVKRNPEHKLLWDWREVRGGELGKVIFTGTLGEIRDAINSEG